MLLRASVFDLLVPSYDELVIHKNTWAQLPYEAALSQADGRGAHAIPSCVPLPHAPYVGEQGGERRRVPMPSQTPKRSDRALCWNFSAATRLESLKIERPLRHMMFPSSSRPQPRRRLSC